jgi:SAM-dependent methyltransferase
MAGRVKWQARRLLAHKPLERETLYDYWRNPPDAGNLPQTYLEHPDGAQRSAFLVELLDKHAPGGSVLELGCNVGRNLSHLRAAGFGELGAIEISSRALAELGRAFPEVAASADLRNGTLEDELPKMADSSWDVVFSMAVLEHVHYDSDWLMEHVVRVARRFVVTIENELDISDRTFPRNYRRVMEQHGARQIEEASPCPGLPGGFVARVFAVE